MTRVPGKPALGAWGTRELEAEAAQIACDLAAARALERAAGIRNTREKTPESEAAYEGRREETARIRRRRAAILEEIDRRNRRDG